MHYTERFGGFEQVKAIQGKFVGFGVHPAQDYVI